MVRKLATWLTTISLIFVFGVGFALSEDDPIMVGAFFNLTGPYASTGQVQQNAVKMAVDEYNAKGGLLGRKIKLLVADAQSAGPDVVSAVCERLVASNIDFIMTGWSSLEFADFQTLGKYDIPFIATYASHQAAGMIRDNLPKFDNLFNGAWEEFAYSRTAAKHGLEIPGKMGWTLPNKNIAIIRSDYPYNLEASDLYAKLAKEKGYEVVVDEVVPLGQKADWNDVLTKLERKKPAIVTVWVISTPDAARFQIQFYERFGKKGYPGIVIYQYTPEVPEWLELVGNKASDGVIWMGAVVRTSDPRVQDYVDRWTAKYGKAELTDGYALHCRDSFDIWAQAVQRAGCVDCYKKVNDLIRESVYEGLWATYAFNPETQHALEGEYLAFVDWAQIQNGINILTHPESLRDG